MSPRCEMRWQTTLAVVSIVRVILDNPPHSKVASRVASDTKYTCFFFFFVHDLEIGIRFVLPFFLLSCHQACSPFASFSMPFP